MEENKYTGKNNKDGKLNWNKNTVKEIKWQRKNEQRKEIKYENKIWRS